MAGGAVWVSGVPWRPTWRTAMASWQHTWRGRTLLGVSLLLLTIVTHVIVVASPGFYSHDEWQRVDGIESLGFLGYMQNYGAFRVGTEFGNPVRPIGFLQQGIAALWMQSSPWLAHLIGVLNHSIAVVLFLWILKRAGFSDFVSALAALLLIFSPLATTATGWLAASFDQLYVIFLMLVAAVAVRLPNHPLSPTGVATLLLATTAALLSKETAVIAIGVVPLIAFIRYCLTSAQFNWRPFAVATVCVAIPIIAYLAFRAPAIAASFFRSAEHAYTPSIANAWSNLASYFAYPFLWKTVELTEVPDVSMWKLAFAVSLHLALVVALYLRVGGWSVVAYLAAYFLFLVPVLLLPAPGGHYMYGSALALSLAIAVIAESLRTSRRPLAALLTAPFIVVLWVHCIAIETRLYSNGVCQANFLKQLDAVLLSKTSGITSVLVTYDEGAPWYVPFRAVSGRKRYENAGQPIVRFAQATRDGPSQRSGLAGSEVSLRWTAACELIGEGR
jgi:hypothetical protein